MKVTNEHSLSFKLHGLFLSPERRKNEANFQWNETCCIREESFLPDDCQKAIDMIPAGTDNRPLIYNPLDPNTGLPSLIFDPYQPGMSEALDIPPSTPPTADNPKFSQQIPLPPSDNTPNRPIYNLPTVFPLQNVQHRRPTISTHRPQT